MITEPTNQQEAIDNLLLVSQAAEDFYSTAMDLLAQSNGGQSVSITELIEELLEVPDAKAIGTSLDEALDDFFRFGGKVSQFASISGFGYILDGIEIQRAYDNAGSDELDKVAAALKAFTKSTSGASLGLLTAGLFVAGLTSLVAAPSAILIASIAGAGALLGGLFNDGIFDETFDFAVVKTSQLGESTGLFSLVDWFLELGENQDRFIAIDDQGSGDILVVKKDEGIVEIDTLNSDGVESIAEQVSQDATFNTLVINNKTFAIEDVSGTAEERNLTIVNSIESITSVAFVISNITIFPGEKINLIGVGIYDVQAGDTIFDIAHDNGLSVKELVSANTWLIDNDRVTFVNDRVLIPEGQTLNISGDNSHVLFGDLNDNFLWDANGGDDRLVGNLGSDELLGGVGNDILWGGDFEDDNAQDTLKGGDDFDTYHAGFDDIIEDSDGKGRIFFAGTLLLDAVKQADDTYIQGGLIYSLDNGTLTVTLENDTDPNHTLTINNFTSGDLGINLLDTPLDNTLFGTEQVDVLSTDTTSSPIRRIVGFGGDDRLKIIINQTEGTSIYGDGEGPEESETDGHDDIEIRYSNGTPVIDFIPESTENGATVFAGGGNDRVFTSYRDDVIFLGSGDDYVESNGGDDFIDGGSGNDFINSDSSYNSDFIDSSDDEDIVIGGAGDDWIITGAGDDVVIGGTGDDVIYGDASNNLGFSYETDPWVFSFINDQPDPGQTSGGAFYFDPEETGPIHTFSFMEEVGLADAGDDILFGGAGEDKIYGGAGDDFLDGGTEDDVLQGEGGDDLLIGGSGQDILWGDKDPLSYENDTQPFLSIDYSQLDNYDHVATLNFRSHSDAIDVAGNDTLDGGAGYDLLQGGGGDDTYVLGFNYDTDIVNDSSGSADKVKLASGITETQIDISSLGGDVLVTLLDETGQYDSQLILSDWAGEGKIESIEFANGIIWDIATIEQKAGGEITSDGITIDAHFTLTAGDDFAQGLDINEAIYGFGGNDLIQAGGGSDRVFGGSGSDTLLGQDGDDFVYGEGGDDQVQGNSGDDHLYGGDGNDFLLGQEGNDIVEGGAGDDELQGDAITDVLAIEFHGNDSLSGGAGNDLLLGQGGNDWLDGGEGNDYLSGDIGDDILLGGGGDDLIFGGSGTDILSGGADNDELQGGGGDDILNGDGGDDRLYGDDGNDLLHGGIGNDRLTGDAGDDVYLFNIGDGQDIIFEQGDSLGDSIILGAGIIPAETFISRDGNDLIITHSQDFSDRLTVSNWFGSVSNKIDHIEFADGTIWDQAEIESRVNFAPTANADTVTGEEDTDIIILASTLTANDTDPENDTLSIFQVNNAMNGVTVLNQDGDVVFTPDQDFFGSASFDYTATDNRGGFDTQTVTVNIANINDAPEAQADTDILLLKPTDITIPPNGDPVLRGGDEFLVNTFSDLQQNKPSIATLSNSGFVVVWGGRGTGTGDSSALGVSGQLLDEFGNKIGTEFLVNTNTNSSQDKPAVATLSDGGFVVVWESLDAATGDNSNSGIAGQRFDGAGNKIGGEFLINTFTQDSQFTPSVAAFSDGGFIVTWYGRDPLTGDTDGNGVSAQIFNASGTKVGSEFLVNNETLNFQSLSDVTVLSNDDFVITWSTQANEVTNFDISGQLFSAGGNKIGTEFLVNTNTLDNQNSSVVTNLPNGGFIITWSSVDTANADTSGFGISGQLFDGNGSKVGNEFLVNTNTLNDQARPSVTTLSDGGFIITWDGQEPATGDISQQGISGQRFDADGNKVDDEFLINLNTLYSQYDSDVTALANGGFAVVWTSADPALGDPGGNDIFGEGIAGRVFRFEVLPPTDNKISINVLGNDLDVDDNLLTFTLDTVSLQGNKGEASIVNNQLFYDAGADFEFLDEGDTATVVIDYTMSDDDGATSSSTATITIEGVNDLPFVEGEILDQVTDEDTSFNFTFPSGIFRDPDADDSLTFTATLSDGSALPAWLSFDPNTQTFGGTPLNNDVEIIDIQVTATDNFGETASETFSLTVNNTNDAPTVNAPLPDHFINAGSLFSYSVPLNTFIDVDVGDTLSYSATQDNGDPLPAWLSFDSQTQQFNGTPSNNDNGTISVEVSVTDSAGITASEIFDLTVNGIPELGIDSFNTLIDTDITITVAHLLSNDNDPDGDPLSVSNFDNAVNGSISITTEGDVLFSPVPGFNGAAFFDYTVGDGRGGLSTQAVTINVLNPITGDAGDNVLDGTVGDDLMDGGAGDDILNGDAGNDILDGGSGNDTLAGGIGNDTYLFGEGGGNDIIVETDTAEGGDILRFADNIAAADVEIIRHRKDLVFTIKSTGETVTLQQWKAGKGAYTITVEFGDGTVLTSDDLNIRQKLGKAGDDTVRGSRKNDRLYGFAGNDIFIAKDGDDLLDGGAGNDLLQGMSGNDTYQFVSGWGNDIIVENDIENDPSSGNTDTVSFGSGITSLDLMFERVSDDLRITQIGSTDTIDIQDWYLGSEYQTEIFRDSEGNTLMNTQVDQLIQAMASFSADSGLNWSDAAQQRLEDVETILAAAWQPTA